MTQQLTLLEVHNLEEGAKGDLGTVLYEIKTNKRIETPFLSADPPSTGKSVTRIVGISRTRWTDDQWKKHYWTQTNENPKELVQRAIEKEDTRTALLLDHIVNGFWEDNRRRKNKLHDLKEFDPDGRWYLLCELQKILKEETK